MDNVYGRDHYTCHQLFFHSPLQLYGLRLGYLCMLWQHDGNKLRLGTKRIPNTLCLEKIGRLYRHCNTSLRAAPVAVKLYQFFGFLLFQRYYYSRHFPFVYFKSGKKRVPETACYWKVSFDKCELNVIS